MGIDSLTIDSLLLHYTCLQLLCWLFCFCKLPEHIAKYRGGLRNTHVQNVLISNFIIRRWEVRAWMLCHYAWQLSIKIDWINNDLCVINAKQNSPFQIDSKAEVLLTWNLNSWHFDNKSIHLCELVITDHIWNDVDSDRKSMIRIIKIARNKNISNEKTLTIHFRKTAMTKRIQWIQEFPFVWDVYINIYWLQVKRINIWIF